jgi:hypothetical protein
MSRTSKLAILAMLAIVQLTAAIPHAVREGRHSKIPLPLKVRQYTSGEQPQQQPKRNETRGFEMTPRLHATEKLGVPAFAVCGNYCGPGWCNGEWLAEQDCDDSVEPETWSATGPSCADSCCRQHDRCCGHEDRHSCNTDIVNCLAACDAASVTCTDDGVPVPAGGIELAMGLVESWCCGSEC